MEETQLEPVSWYRLTLGHGENLKKELLDWAEDRDVSLAWVQCLGELRDGKTASGYDGKTPREAQKFMEELEDNRHVMGVGTIRRDGETGQVHLHGPMGRRRETATGCWAGEPETYRGMELLVTVFEKSK